MTAVTSRVGRWKKFVIGKRKVLRGLEWAGLDISRFCTLTKTTYAKVTRCHMKLEVATRSLVEKLWIYAFKRIPNTIEEVL